MSEPVPLANVARPKAPAEYSQVLIEAIAQALERDLARKFDRRSDLALEPGKRLVLAAASSNTRFAISINASGHLVLVDYATGATAEFVVDWESVSGLSAQLAALQTGYEDADASLDAAIDIVAAVAATNGTAISTLSSEVTAARDGETSLLAKVTSIDTAIADETSVRAAADDTVQASVYSTAARPNLIPLEYQVFGEDEDLPFVVVAGSKGATTVDNPFLQRDAQVVTSDTVQTFFQIRFHAVGGLTNITLPPGRYAYKIQVQTNANVTHVAPMLRNGSDALEYSTTHPRAASAETYEGVWDLTAETVTEFYFALNLTKSSAGVSGACWLRSFQISPIPDDADTAGEWNLGGLNAQARILREAFVNKTTGKAVAQIILEAAAGGGLPTRIGLRNGSDGSSDIALLAAQIFLGDETVFEDTYNTIYTESSSIRTRLLGPFGASGNLTLWKGPTSVALNSETATNGIMALTDTKLYLGTTPATALTGATVSPSYDLDIAFGTYSGTCGPYTITTQGGDGTYTYATEQISGDDYFTISNGTTAAPSISWDSDGAPAAGSGTFRTTVTETSSGKKAQIDFVAEFIDSGPP